MSRLNETLEETKDRFLRKVNKDSNGCWIWKGGGKRYGVFSIKRKSYGAHRVSYELFKGKIPPNLFIDHLCRVTLCVNPEHLEAVTCRENLLRGNTEARKKSLQIHCINGHLLTGHNLKLSKNGIRHCKKCDVIAHKKYYLKNAEILREKGRKYYFLSKLQEA